MTAQSLVIKITAGLDDPERCNQALNVAAAALASGVPTSLWLTGEASWFALPGRAADFKLPHAPPLADLLDAVLAAGLPSAVLGGPAPRAARWPPGRVRVAPRAARWPRFLGGPVAQRPGPA